MKVVLRLFNVIIMAISFVATLLLFATKSFSFNSNIALDVANFAKFVPETQFTSDIDIVGLLGTDAIHVRIAFDLDPEGMYRVMDGNKEKINENIIVKNVDDIVTTLHEPVDLITDFTIRSTLKSIIKNEITTHVDEAVKKYGSTSTAEEVMDEVGMTDAYFTGFTNTLYEAANEDDATVESLTNVLYWQIDEALHKAEESGVVDNSGFTDEKKTEISDNLIAVLDDLELVREDGSLKKMSEISYIYLSKFLKVELEKKVADDEKPALNQQAAEKDPDYADRMVRTFVVVYMPDAFYQIVGITSLCLFIGLFVFAIIWGLLFILTLIRTFSKTPWTIFGPWFWILGSLQIVLGLGITIFGKFYLPKIKLSFTGLPLQYVVLVPRTYALIPSIMFIAMMGIGIVYFILKKITKKQMYRKLGL